VIRFGLLAGATPIAFAATRYALSSVAIAALAAVTRIPRPSIRSLGLSAVVGVPLVGVYGLLLYIGEESTSGGLSAILIAVVPLLTVLIALPILPGEKLGTTALLGVVIGFVGVFALVFPPPGVTLATTIWGPLAVIGAAVSFALGSVVLRAKRPEGETLWGVAVQFAVATVFLSALLPVIEPHSAFPLSGDVLESLAYLVLLPSLAGYALYFALHHRVGPGRANVVAYVNPVAALVVGGVVFAEPFNWWELVGFALVVVGLALVMGFLGRRRS
jgi:probable blue pigment (indigoidine) exporter